MQSFVMGGIAAIVATATASHASAGATPRTAEVILMTSKRPALAGELGRRKPVQRQPLAGSSDPVAVSNPIAAFRTHDLSRRWVRLEMANSFAASADNEPAQTENLVARQVDGAPAISGLPRSLVRPPSIVIPAWMRAGFAFSTAPTSMSPGCAPNLYRPAGFLDRAAEDRRFGYYQLMGKIACQHGIPIGLFDALIIRESRYNADIFSAKSAYGLTQLMPGTAAGLGVDRYDAAQNLEGGARYLRQQLDRFGRVHLALAAYNAGPGRVRNGIVPPIAETQAYVDSVLTNWRRLAGLYRTAVLQTRGAEEAPLLAMPAGRGASVSSF